MILYRTKGPGPPNRHLKGNWYEFPDEMAAYMLVKHKDHWSGDPKDARPPVEKPPAKKKRGLRKQREEPKPSLGADRGL